MLWELVQPQELYCAPELVCQVNNTLSQLGYVIFEQDLSDKRGENLYRTKPKWINVQEESNYQYKMNEENLKNENFTIWTDCGRTSAAIVGSPISISKDCTILNNGNKITKTDQLSIQDQNEGQQLATSLLLSIQSKMEDFQSNKQQNERKKKILTYKSNESNFLSGIIGFDKNRLQKQETIVRAHPQVETSHKLDVNNQNLEKLTNLWKIYAEIFLSDCEGDFFKDNQLNQFLEPNVGDSLVVMPATLAPQWQRSVPPPTLYSPNFHWAPVCFVDNSEEFINI